MEVVVVGAGAVGIALASFLHQAGASVSLVARGGTAERLREQGLSRTGLFGSHAVPPRDLRIEEHLADWNGDCDWVCVCTKTTAVESVADALSACEPRWKSPPGIVVFHNGWGSAEVIADRVPPERVFSARVITGFRRPEATVSDVTVHADAVLLGSLFGADPGALGPLADALCRAGLPTRISPDIGRDLWAKLVYNCALNPLGALRGVPYGELAATPATRRILERVVHELFAVMRASGLATHWEDPQSYLRDFYAAILPPTAEHESSMLQDLRAGRRTEIDALSGAVVRLAARHGVDVPVNAALLRLVKAIEAAR